MGADADVFPGEIEPLAEIEERGELAYGGLAGQDFLGRGVGEEPGGKSLLAGAGADGAEKLEETAFAEEIEIASVGMGGIEVAVTGLAGAGPAVFEAGNATLIKGTQAVAAAENPQNPFMEDKERNKHNEGEQETEDERGVIADEPDGENEDDDGGEKLRGSKDAVAALVPELDGMKRLQTALVFLRGRDGLRWLHLRIISGALLQARRGRLPGHRCCR
jgi:hypothetical protein